MNQLAPIATTTRLPTLVAAAGQRASLRFLGFFASTIRNPHTRRAYGRAVGAFLAWCEEKGRPVGRGRPAASRGRLDRAADGRARRAEREAAARGDPASIRLAGHRPGGRGARAIARRAPGVETPHVRRHPRAVLLDRDRSLEFAARGYSGWLVARRRGPKAQAPLSHRRPGNRPSSYRASSSARSIVAPSGPIARRTAQDCCKSSHAIWIAKSRERAARDSTCPF